MSDASYSNKLIEKITNSKKWPYLERQPFLKELEKVAENAYCKDTTEGYLASVLIYHQLCEELIKLLIEYSDFFLQVAIYPAEINFTHSQDRMFGQLIKELESTISFKDKDKFIVKCRDLNRTRIELVHKLTFKTSLADINTEAKEMKLIYDEIYTLFEGIWDYFVNQINSYSRDIDWKEFKD